VHSVAYVDAFVKEKNQAWKDIANAGYQFAVNQAVREINSANREI
jgi:hypothetical protein